MQLRQRAGDPRPAADAIRAAARREERGSPLPAKADKMRHYMQLTKLIAASGNEGKIKEIVKIFKGVEIIPMHDAGF